MFENIIIALIPVFLALLAAGFYYALIDEDGIQRM